MGLAVLGERQLDKAAAVSREARGRGGCCAAVEMMGVERNGSGRVWV
jgi:hypothetical protein